MSHSEQENEIIANLTPTQRDLLEQSIYRSSFRKGEIIHRHEEDCIGVIFVRKGCLAFSVISEEGREITLFRSEKGESCILSASCVFDVIDPEGYVSAETNVELDVLPAPILAQLMRENVQVECAVYKQAAKQYADILHVMQHIVFFSLEKRLAIFLKNEYQRQEKLSFSITHEQIARYIGSSREVITRTLNQFSARGLVSLGRGTVTILNLQGLMDLLS